MLEVMLWAIIAYGIGSIPIGWIVSFCVRGQDIRQQGSRSMGTTNVMRTVGKKWGILTFVGDALKGMALAALGLNLESQDFAMGDFILPLGVVGHIWPLWLKFQGGKGVAVFLGGLLWTSPLWGLISIALWGLITALTRYSVLGSLVACCAGVGGLLNTLEITGFVISLPLILYAHRSNLMRLWRGHELKI